MGDIGNADALQLVAKRLAVVDDMVSAKILNPRSRLGTRSGADDGEGSELPCQLREYGSHAAARAHDEQSLASRALARCHAEAVEQQFPSSDAGQRQSGCLRKVQAARHVADDAFIHQLAFGVAACAADVARIPDPVAGLEDAHLGAHRAHDASSVPAEHLPRSGLGLARGPDLRIHRVDRYRHHIDQQVASAGLRLRQLHVLQRKRIGDGQGRLEGSGFHRSALIESRSEFKNGSQL